MRDKEHVWNGCKCQKCSSSRDEGHDWSKNCEQCAKCRKTRDGAHVWDACRCQKCSSVRREGHDWSKDCEQCAKCGTTSETYHDWSKDCEKCAKCGKTRDVRNRIAACVKALDGDSKAVLAAVSELVEIGAAEGISPLLALWKRSDDDTVIKTTIQALRTIVGRPGQTLKGYNAVPTLLLAAGAFINQSNTLLNIARLLRSADGPSWADLLAQCYGVDSGSALLRRLASSGDGDVVHVLLAVLNGINYDTFDNRHRISAIHGLAALGQKGLKGRSKEIKSALVRKLGHYDSALRCAAVEALAQLGEPKWRQWVDGTDNDQRQLGRSNDPEAVGALIYAMSCTPSETSKMDHIISAIWASTELRFGKMEFITELLKIEMDPHSGYSIREAAASARHKLI